MNPNPAINPPAAPVVEEDYSAMGGRNFLCKEEIRNVTRDGKGGFLVRVGLTSYRSLPLSCIERIELSIDGTPVKAGDMRLILNGNTYSLDELKNLSRIWWFILDNADLFVLRPEPLPAGTHVVEGLLVTVEPYVTGGRFSFFNSSKKLLSVAEEL